MRTEEEVNDRLASLRSLYAKEFDKETCDRLDAGIKTLEWVLGAE